MSRVARRLESLRADLSGMLSRYLLQLGVWSKLEIQTRVWGDAAYSGQRDVIQQHVPGAKSFVQTKAHRHRPLSETERARNRTKSKVRAKVEHVFLVMKQIFGWTKVRYRGLAKNMNWLFVTCGLTNLWTGGEPTKRLEPLPLCKGLQWT
jgi:IS5 family transposase